MKRTSIFGLLILALPLWANMASPFVEGTMPGSPFISQAVDIEHEYLTIRPDSNKISADIVAEYHIRVDSAGTDIPFLFYAMGYDSAFEVRLDGDMVVLDSIPLPYQNQTGTLLKDFAYLFDKDSSQIWLELPEDDHPNGPVAIFPSHLHFFSADLDTGRHVIRVQYQARAEIDLREWVKVFRYQYALAPAKYWRSFGGLTLRIDARALSGMVRTDLKLGLPDSGHQAAVAKWEFDSLPTEVLILRYQTKITGWPLMLRVMGPGGITALLGIPLIGIHLIWFLMFRARHPRPKRNWVRIVGAVLVPLLVLLIFIMSFEWIDQAIGPDASRYHGYYILAVFSYPIWLVVYALLTWGIDRGVEYLRRSRS